MANVSNLLPTGILHGNGCAIEPIQIVHRSRTDALLRSLFPRREVNLRPPPLPVLRSAFGFGPSLEVLPLRTFDWSGTSTRDSAYYLSCYAQLRHYDLLVLSKFAISKAGWDLKASFSSLLSIESKVPVLLLGADCMEPGLIRSILFPVNDPYRCSGGFQDLLDLSKLSGAKVTLLYRFADQADIGLWNSPDFLQMGSTPFYEPELMLAENAKLNLISSWINVARAEGLEVELKFNNSTQGIVADILAYQQELDFDLIAIDPSFFESFYLERALRYVLRRSRCPIWVPHPMGQSACKEGLEILEERLLYG